MKTILVELTLNDIDMLDEALEDYIKDAANPPGDDWRKAVAKLSLKINSVREQLLFLEETA